MNGPWHAGEIALQDTLGVAARMDEIGRKVIRNYMPDQHRDFFARLPFAVFGTVDSAGRPWATLRAGEEGFMHSPQPQSLVVELPPQPDDPAQAGLRDGAAVGMLGIELHTRRRNRLNGRLRALDEGRFEIGVGESFGNCPQYIHVRDYRFERQPGEPSGLPARRLPQFDALARDLVGRAGTFFVATYSGEGEAMRVDVSHRGGPPGFVRIGRDGTLVVPDYEGNRFFSTLGNILLNGKAGLVFPDFDSGGLLQMSGDARVVLDGPERHWEFTPREIVWREDALPLRWALQAA
ncbi:flavin-nucleotide-binding protein [Pseudoduganella sp. DS3]|uniref:Flavin-nucleotide-binding protein n=1 Tax=Pseudoduganella guangdongensis TaxID=2692179 RepID=A0A6N9HI59_9BURK|nr:pyridoxamine 5'-phosphate oxidase family protein [Pseudoduganella guangdongensis]MYN03288.1 flavin-nucleotide-binding protein [Pseudoduganella guangdongensis]